MPVLAHREIHLNEEVFELVLAIKIQRRKTACDTAMVSKGKDINHSKKEKKQTNYH